MDVRNNVIIMAYLLDNLSKALQAVDCKDPNMNNVYKYIQLLSIVLNDTLTVIQRESKEQSVNT